MTQPDSSNGKGQGHRFTANDPATIEAARKGGRKVSEDRAHMSEIGRDGYWATGEKYGFKTANKIAFGQHLTKGQAKQARKEREAQRKADGQG